MNELNFSNMKHRVLSHYQPYKNRALSHAGREPGPDIPNAYRLFFQESLRSMGPTASMFPSSRYLANALTRPIDFRRARTVVELGPGTGAVTNEILKRMRPDAKLFVNIPARLRGFGSYGGAGQWQPPAEPCGVAAHRGHLK